MKNSIFFLFTLNVALLCGAFGSPPIPNQTGSFVAKRAWYTQVSPNELVLDPIHPYSFGAWANYPKNISMPIENATLSVGGRNPIPMSKALSLSSDTIGVYFEEYFTNYSDLNSSYPDNASYAFNVNFASGNNQFNNFFNDSVSYAPKPVISAVSNCVWSGAGYIIVLDPSQPFTVSWPGGNNLQAIIMIQGGSSFPSFPGFSTTLSNETSFTFTTDLINSLPSNTIIPVLFEDWIDPTNEPWGNAYNNYNTFGIFIPKAPFLETPLDLGKNHVLLQTDVSPVDYVPSMGVNGTYYGWDRGPFSFTVTSPQMCSITTPNNITLPTKVNADGYNYSSGGMTKSAMDSAYPNGIYKISSGQNLSLPKDSYPSIPKVLSVNGRPAQWANGHLLLKSGKKHTIT
jgi:hypothetical protein